MVLLDDLWFENYYDSFLATATLDSEYMKLNAKKEAEFFYKKLEMQPGYSLLDVPCGIGRHTQYFVERGIELTGVDISHQCLNMAKNSDFYLENFEKVNYLHGNMMDLSQFSGKFDYVLNIFTSFGYFKNDEENFESLLSIVDSLKKFGKIGITLMNRTWVENNFRSTDWEENDDYFLLTKRKYDRETKYLENDWIFIDKHSKQIKRYPHRLRLYSRSEITELLKKVSINNIEIFGGVDGSVFSENNSFTMYICGQKK